MRDVTGPLGRRPFGRAVAVAGTLALAVPAWLLVAWIVIFYRVDAGHEVRVALFLSMLPGFMRHAVSITLIALACSIAALMAGIFCVRGNGGAVRAAGVAQIALGTSLACLLLFSLM